MPRFKVVHHVGECIGCEHNAIYSRDLWEMNGQVAHLRRSTKEGNEGDTFVLEMDSEQEFERHRKPAECCPVRCIHLYKDGKRLF